MVDTLTYVHPRTMEQAFGPGERGPLLDRDAYAPMDWQDKLVLWVAPAVVIFVVVLLMTEGV